MQKILVPTDFSKNALKALTYASEVAQKTGATIYLLHSIEISINMANMQSDSSNPKIVKERSDLLKLSVDSVNTVFPGVHVITHLSGGGPVETILDYAEKEKIRLKR